jgi:hypothetical protein
MKVYIVMTQEGWKSDHVNIESVHAKRSDATKAQEKFYKMVWDDMYDEDWPGFRKADLDAIGRSGAGAWIEERKVRVSK